MPKTQTSNLQIVFDSDENSKLKYFKRCKTGRPRKITRRRKTGEKIPLFLFNQYPIFQINFLIIKINQNKRKVCLLLWYPKLLRWNWKKLRWTQIRIQKKIPTNGEEECKPKDCAWTKGDFEFIGRKTQDPHQSEQKDCLYKD